jgi:hypothetical protein
MLVELLGGDQTIDLGCWTPAVGMRRTFWEALPALPWAACFSILDVEGCPHESLYVLCQGHSLHLTFLPPSYWQGLSLVESDLPSLAARISSKLPTGPPVLCTIVLDRQAGSEIVVAALVAPHRSAPFRARLLAEYGRHWVNHATSPLISSLVRHVLTVDIAGQLRALARQHAGQALVFHRGGLPATRGGFRLIDGYPRLLAPDELSSLPGAIWVDERLVAEGLSLTQRALTPLGASSPGSVYGGLASLLQRGYLRFPRDGAVRRLRWLPRAAAAAQVKRWLSPPSLVARPLPVAGPGLTMALYFRFDAGANLPAVDDSSDEWERCRRVLEVLARHPQVQATIGWTQAAVERLIAHAPDVLQSYRAAVASGQLETAHAGSGLPFPLCNSRELVRSQSLAWQASASQGMPMPTLGFVPPGGKLAPGWGEVLRGHGYAYVAASEEQVRSGYAQFDPSQPVSIEGWPAVCFHHELERVLSAGIDWGVLDLYLHLLAADHSMPVLATSLAVDQIHSLTWLERFFQDAQQSGHLFSRLSHLAAAPSQGVTEAFADPQGLLAWTGDERNRQLNALVAQAQIVWQDVLSLCAHAETYQHQEASTEHFAAPEPSTSDAPPLSVGTPAFQEACAATRVQIDDVRRAASSVQGANDRGWFASEAQREADIAEARRAVAACCSLARQQLARLSPFPRLPADALGIVRVYDAHAQYQQASLARVQIPLPDGVAPQALVFLHHGLPIAAQFIHHTDRLAHYLLSVSTGVSDMVDLAVLPGHPVAYSEGLDITTRRMCNPWLVVLLDQRGQITSIRYQGREQLCGPSNTIRGQLLQSGTPLQPELAEASITVSKQGPLAGSVTVRQALTPDVELVRRIQMSKFSPLLECVTRLSFAQPAALAQELIIGEFRLAGQEATWAFPLQAGMCSVATTDIPSVILAPEDSIDVHTASSGLRYLVHQPTTRTCLYAAQAVDGGLQLGLIGSMPSRVLDLNRIATRPGLGFPGQTYVGSYTYRHALLPLAADVELRAAAYNHSLLWAFFPVRLFAG